MTFRHELKHRVTLADYCVLRSRLTHAMQLDPSCGTKGWYRVKSLYFDNYRDKALKEKIDGVDKREKFRIRYYNENLDLIRLEKKSKQKGLNHKASTAITLAQANALIAGEFSQLNNVEDPLLLELLSKMKSEQLRPKTIVQYNREAYLYKPGNVRATFDSDLKTGLFSTNLFEENLPLVPMMEPVALLEVKYDAFLPDHIRKLLQLGSRSASAFSKYASCRIYG